MATRKLISATDTQYSGALLSSLNEQRIHGVFCDVTIIVEDKKFRAHRNILSASSTYLHHLLSMAGEVVELNFVKAEIFSEILNYIYSSKVVGFHSDLLEELIKSGKSLGIKFIADLHIPFSQMKSMASGVVGNGMDQKGNNIEKLTTDVLIKDSGTGARHDTADKSSTSIDKPNEKVVHCVGNSEGSDDDDVIFFSELVPPKRPVSNHSEIAQERANPDGVNLPSQQMNIKNTFSPQAVLIPKSKSPMNTPFKCVTPLQTNSAFANISNPTQIQASTATLSSSQNPTLPNTMSLHQHQPNSSNISSIHQQLPSNNIPLNNPMIISDSSCPSSPDILTSSLDVWPNTNAQYNATRQNPQTTFRQGDLMIKNADVDPEKSKDCSLASEAGQQPVLDAKKIITLEDPCENGRQSTGSKAYTNIVEGTCDMIISIDNDSEDDGEVELPRSMDGSPDSKRVKVKHEDHYQLIDDGKVYYICIECNRSYASLRSVKRHFNLHSWEYKYPCRYCGKVFPLGEYRSKHEVIHTGEKRYQCLTCGECFSCYRAMSAHMKSVHSQDPSRDPKLYLLHPSRSSSSNTQNADNSNAHPSSSSLVINDDGIVCTVDVENNGTASQEITSGSPSKPMTWDDFFVQPGKEHFVKGKPSKDNAEIEFVIPEFY
ncbi:transcriptional regulator Kaiso-like [Ambystoma mexicanum]|uniref:transcriptional regulator Kaiso-like n=1 Tax=Ambystoma mexicanum TaxID=8296 RepID=UPI0037E91213